MQYQAPTQWLNRIWSTAPFTQLSALGFAKLNEFPDHAWLNRHIGSVMSFIDQDTFDNDGRYYEEIIYESNQIPTRSQNWHDLFNGAIWAQFPRAKRALNRQHIEDIKYVGLNPRTPRRNRITQFDECGVIIVYHQSDIPALLMQHQWHQAFVARREQWHKNVQAWIFGHANFEMLLDPFIGLTGKWLGIEMPRAFFNLSQQAQLSALDDRLTLLIEDGLFLQSGVLKPLPLLGVPGWHEENKDAAFYANTAYFMPKRDSTKPT